ncbi:MULTISPECIES: response regulator [unclassified Pseudodesulfovibrio]|uniref:response regulator n=1 Tax=unclassified Pseudodesulfovibrio TaxID=2661612 RepID=UPI000FEBBF06|nr:MULTISPECIES: response regulator [unclassified Pseudodesulfovibrio]MCJ2165070.1 response regulator [Pseudodesulfovibrio sp. S3-i]RWU03490.1 response regulator [Pseudodesulfovibrio sp. S3]
MAKILIAEDDRISQKLAVKIVEELGHTAFVSPHGKHAYETLLASNDFDLLLTDIMMPEMDGQQLIQTLRGDQQFDSLPIIIMSAVVGINDISNLLKLGATLFMAKPLDRQELQSYISRCLGSN